MDVAAWLRQLGLERYAPVFRENEIDWEVVADLTEADLEKLGLPLGPRKKLLKAIAALSAPSSAHPRDEAPSGAIAQEAERRQLTVMFCDLAGSTELAEELDPEQLRALMGRYHDVVARAVTDHEGHVAKLLGDGVLAYFGWPQAHEDDAERAVRTALAAVASVGAMEGAGRPLAARAGIATGPVVVGDVSGEAASERGAVSGATPNLAARLQALAAPGEVVIGEGTRRLVAGAFDLEERGRQSVKGFTKPLAVWRVRGVARTASRFEALHGARLTGFVGRREELGLLTDRWARARSGEGQVVLVSGEAGIGKSRLVREFEAVLAVEDCQPLRYQCSPHETDAAFQPIAAEIADTAGLAPDQPPETRLDRLEDYLAAVFVDTDEAMPLLAPLLGLPIERYPPVEMAPQRRKQRVIALLAERIARLSRDGPLALLVEDIHWIDPSSLEAFEAIVARARDLPILAVMTHRPEFSPPWAGHGHATLHSLDRLGHGEGRAIVERVAGGKTMPAEVLERILARTDGVPLFIEELTRAVLEAGVLEERHDRYVLDGPLPEFAIPMTLQDSLMARLDRLASAKRVIQAAACIGREFDAELLATALGAEPEELVEPLNQLVGAQLVFRRGVEGRYVFKHALVQDAAYASLLTTTRRSLHERLAAELEKTGSPDPLELARHHFEAGAKDRAAELYLAAGRRLIGSSAAVEAIGALGRGLRATQALSPSERRDRLELQLRAGLGTARTMLGGWQQPSVLEVLKPAYDLARKLNERDLLGGIFWLISSHFAARADIESTRRWVRDFRPIATAEENADTDLPIIHCLAASNTHFWMAELDDAVACVDRLERIYRPERHVRIAELINHDPISHAQNFGGSLAEWIRGYPDRAFARLDKAVRRAREVRHPFDLMFNLTAGASCLIYLDHTERLLAQCDEAEQVAQEEALGPFAELVCIAQWRGAGLIRRGDFERGYALVKEGNDFWNAIGGRLCDALFKSWIVEGLRGLGRIDEGLEVNARTIAHCRETGDRFMEAECVRMRGELVLAGQPPDVEAAERLFREAIAIAQAQKAKSWELRAATSLARLWAAHGRHAEARNVLASAHGWFAQGFDTPDLERAKRLLQELG